MMDTVINRFIGSLRRSGVDISPAESIDALRALTCVQLADRETTKAALSATLIKKPRDLPVFEAVFDLYFAAPQAMAAASAPATADASAAAALPEGKRVALDTEDDGIPIDGEGGHTPRDTVKIQPGSLEKLARNLVVKRAQAMLDQLMQRASHQANVRSASASARPGPLTVADGSPTLDADLRLSAFEQLLRDQDDPDAEESLTEQLSGDGVGPVAVLPEHLLRDLERHLAQQPARDREVGRQRGAPSQRFSEAERREMEDIVRRLGRRMRGARSYRRAVSHRGRIHVARTLRRSMIYDGIPFKPVVTCHSNEKPRLVVICDISLSVRSTARFTLHLVYSVQELFDQVRSFVFVSDLADASQYFEQLSIDEAIAAVIGNELIDCDANSNYGRALEIFCRCHLTTVNNQTTVIILGDGRGNRNPPNVAALEEIRRRAKQLIWLSPEPCGSWGVGSSDMLLYEAVCHRAEVVRNLTQLGEVADALIRRHGARSFHG